MDLAHRVVFAEDLEALLQVDVLARQNGCGALRCDLLQQVRVHPWDYVLYPREVILLVGLAEPDDGLHPEVTEVVHGKGNVQAHRLPHRGDEFLEQGDALVGHFHHEQRMWDRVHLPLGQVRAHGDRARFVRDQINTQVHFEPSESFDFLAFLHSLGIDPGVLGLGRVGVDSDFVAELAAQHRVHGRVVDLAGDVPQRHLDRAHAAGLAGGSAELLDLAENPVDLERILARDAALEHQRVGRTGAVAHLAQPVHALVGVDADNRAGERRLDDGSHAQVRDLQLGRTRIRVDVLRIRFRRLASYEGAAQGRGGGLQDAATIDKMPVGCAHGAPSCLE